MKKPKVVVEMPKPALPLARSPHPGGRRRARRARVPATVLEDAGAEVIEAADGDEAIAHGPGATSPT